METNLEGFMVSIWMHVFSFGPLFPRLNCSDTFVGFFRQSYRFRLRKPLFLYDRYTFLDSHRHRCPQLPKGRE